MDPELEDMYGRIEQIAKALPTWALENELKARVLEERKFLQPFIHPEW